MIESIKEINFPQYATLSQATVVLNDMGDRTITADVKIDGAVTPDFSYDWEVEFKGERYIQPLRKPQALKDNQSLKSTISLTFYHWAIYQLKRDFFVELASTQAGTAFADKYVVPLAVNLEEFVVAFNQVLSYYFPDGKIYGVLNPDWEYDSERQYVDINYSYLWDVLQKTHELFNVRWSIEKDNNGNYAIRFGYPAGELTHVFEYGFEGGLLKVERQVQDANIRNKILGRGGSRNLPYLYFKDYNKYPFGGDGNQGMTPDPDAIPELSNIFFSELRDSNFRSYVQGWKTNVNRQLVAGDTLNAFDAERAKTDYAYMRGATDEKFDPVEYVKDDASIAEYGELVGKLENNEEIFPSLQGMEIDITVPGGETIKTRADEVVAVQEVVTDGIASDEVEVKNDIKLEAKSETSHGAGSNTFVATESTITVSSNEVVVPDGYEGTLFDIPTVKYTLEWKERIKQYMQYKQYYEGDKLNGNVYSNGDEAFPSVSYKVIDVISGKEVHPVNLPGGRYRVDYTLKFPAVTLGRGIIHAQQTPNGLGQTERVSVYWLKRIVKTSAAIICKSFNGDVILNKVDGVSISKSVSVAANAKTTISISGDTFTVPAQGAMMVDVPISVTPEATTTYSEKTVKVVNAKTNEIVPAINIPEGEYKLLVDVTLTNESSSAKTLKVELLPAYLYFVDNTEKWEPTFDVWIKNIFNTKKSDYASEAAYVEGVWSPLRTENDMAVTFSSGNLSGHDSWEFRIKKGGIAYDNSKVITDSDGNEVRSEWRLTLIKSDAELETIKKYIPYKDFNAKAGDLFFFTGIYLPHQYVLSAEKELTQYKEDNLSEVSDIKSQWVISLDKVRAHRGDADRLVDALSVGSAITLKDKRFTKSFGEKQILQSITYEWQESALLPNIDVVLSDKVTTTLSTVGMLQGKVDALAKQVGGLSNLEQIIRKVGDLLYLRKDGFEDTSYSPTKFSDQVKFEKTVSSENFKPGAVGGTGWAAYQDENGQSVIEADKLFVRNEMQVNSLIINQIAALGGTKILSAADITITAVEPVSLADGSIGDRCFFDTKGTSKANLFMVNDIAYSNMFDSENAELKYYKRKVVEVGEDYITLSTTEGVGEGTPQEGDVIVQFGNFTDITRQSFIVIDPLNGGKIEVFSGVNSFDTKDCNKVGMGVNPSTNEAFLYGYGDMFLGDRDLKDNYITFQKRKGDTEKKLFIKADVQIGAGSSGLSNLSEWAEKQEQIDGAQESANKAQQSANKAQTTADTALTNAQEADRKAQSAQSVANSATSKLNEWASDNVISPLEKQGLKNEISFIKGDYEDIFASYKKYIQEFDRLILSDGKQYVTADGYIFNIEVANENWINYESAYRLYLSDLENKTKTSDTVAVGNLAALQSGFYTKRTAILEDISLAIKSEADYAVKRANSAISDAEAARAYVDVVKKELLDQIDGAITNWFGEEEPTLSNYPAKDWTTDADKDAHLGDLYYSGTGKVYRFQKDASGTYEWRYIPDNDLAEALALAQKAQDTADGKRRIFIEQPFAPYDAGDLWAGGENYPLKVCRTPKVAGEAFNSNDWIFADNSNSYAYNLVNNTVSSLNKAIEDAQKAAKNYTDEGKVALQKSIDALNEAKADLSDVYTKAEADKEISDSESAAIARATELAEAARIAAETNAKAYADGEITQAEQDAIAKANENLEIARKNLQDAIDEVTTSVENVREMASNAQSTALSASNTLNQWSADNVISPLEKQGLRDELAFINADYQDIFKNYQKYIQEFDTLILSDGKQYVTEDGYVFNVEVANTNWTSYRNAYNAYKADLESKTATNDNVAVGNLAALQSSFYDARTAILEDISLSIKAEADYSKKTAQEASKNVENLQEQVKSDYDYLTDIFGKNNNLSVQGAVMTQMVAVADVEEGEDVVDANVKAIFNGSGAINDDEHGTLILAGGIPESTSEGKRSLVGRAKEASTRIYEDGCTFTKKMHLEDGCTIGEAIHIVNGGIELNTASAGEVKITEGDGFFSQNEKMTVSVGGSGCSNSMLTAYTKGANIGCPADPVPVVISSNIDDAIRCFQGTFGGLRPRVRTMTTQELTHEVDTIDHTLMVDASSRQSILLPRPAMIGQECEFLFSNKDDTQVKHSFISEDDCLINNSCGGANNLDSLEVGAYGSCKFVCAYNKSGQKRWWFYRIR